MRERLRKVIAFYTMPFKWIVRGCFDWEAASVAIRHGTAYLFLGRGWRF